ncbi:MAG: lipoyl(octanoyl) transferase LipB [Betaproteobacteria bacterium]|nr:lipoyl(octanoyl) transferase LipB [Betaproteobacteria bacterium]NBY05505.1 lipoyl(octanoyl) transferase LipB [Betaproteobacteria bacterium]
MASDLSDIGALHVRDLGEVQYLPTCQAMQDFTAQRGPDTPDELWLCQHPPVFTQGLAGRDEHLLVAGDIPMVRTNRGGQITYHGPGQILAYPLLDLKRRGFFVKELVYRLEGAVIKTLLHFGLTGHRVAGAAGVYLQIDDPRGHARLPQRPTRPTAGAALPKPVFDGLGKVAALGIKVSRHCSYHGVALNVAMDLSPYQRINPCGHAGLKTVDLSTMGVQVGVTEVAHVLSQKLADQLAPRI